MTIEYEPFKYFSKECDGISVNDFALSQKMVETSVMATESIASTQSLDKSVAMFKYLNASNTIAEAVYAAKDLAYSQGTLSAALYHLMDCYSRIGQFALRKHEYLRKYENNESLSEEDKQTLDRIHFWLGEWHVEATYNIGIVFECIKEIIKKKTRKSAIIFFTAGLFTGYILFGYI